MWATTFFPKMLQMTRTPRTTTKPAPTATAISRSQLSVPLRRKTYARCVWFSSATHDLHLCHVGTSGSVHPAWHNWSNRLAVARYAALTATWSSIHAYSLLYHKDDELLIETVRKQINLPSTAMDKMRGGHPYRPRTKSATAHFGHTHSISATRKQ